ncbi:VTT domain-containing protein [Fictibacillus nanhaiensis]|uniref:TVP38/TMEM64 family protein n=1 Tax=Fictibacillus nanhaiensis TaxID=742169 RepID=UPI001C957DD7|nr:VTT domain-containing protein [Fictibacillus nanhaiensis]MBY6037870.1 VTT domain-containing protein [Fictibacillus nanhaiensis]
MTETIIAFFYEYSEWAITVSIILNIVIAILGLVPSVFLTAANIVFFGFWTGTLISFIGEAIGALVSFVLYRKGFKRVSRQKLEKYPLVVRLLSAKGKEAFVILFSLRMLPFVPSGLVTFAGAIGAVSVTVFVLASSIGKIPALLLEAYSVYNITEWNTEGKIILGIIAAACLFGILKKRLFS